MQDQIPAFDEWVKKRTPRDRVFGVARSEGISDDVAEDYIKVTKVESGHNVNVRNSSKGARGFGQVIPDTKGGNVRTVGGRKYDLRDPDQNITAGLRYFAEGGDDPVARRLHYFGGPKARQRYERTGKIPNISDGNMTASQYVRATGGQRQPPKFDEWTPDSGVPTFDDWAKDSEQNLPPDRRVTDRPSVSPRSSRRSAPKTPPLFKSVTASPEEHAAIEAGIVDAERRRAPMSMGELRRQDELRTQRLQRVRQEVEKEQAAGAQAMRTAPSSAQARLYDPRLNVDETVLRRYTNPRYGRSPEEIAAAEQAERERRERVSKLPISQKLAQVPKSAGLGLAQTAESSLKSIAVLSKKLNLFGEYTGKEASDLATYQAGEYISKRAREILRSNPDLEPEFLAGKAPQAVGQAVSFLLGGIATKSPKLTVSILGAGMTTGSAYDEVKAAGGSEDEAVNAGLLAGAILGPSELIGMRGMMKAIQGTAQEATLREALKTALREGRRDVVENALQEAGQEYLQGKITEVPRTAGQILEAAALGGLAAGVVTPSVTLATQVGRRRGTQTEVQPTVEAQRETVEPAETANVARAQTRPVADIGTEGTVLPADTAPNPQRFYHKDWGEVEVLEDQSGARPGRVKVAEVADPTKQHFPKRSDLTGKGNQRMVPVRTESAIAPEQITAEDPMPDVTRAYHGSRHEFDDFTLQKIGAGEGNQAYGWGLYFTGSKKVAEFYKGAGKTNRWNWPPEKAEQNFDEFTPTEQYLIAWLDHPVNRHVGNRAEAIAGLEAEAQQADRQAWKPQIDEAIRYLKDHPQIDVAEGGGRVYEVELAPKPDEWLDWDKPLSEQSPRVQKLLQSAGVFNPDKKAEDFYWEMQAKAPKESVGGRKVYPQPNPRKASKFLRSIGVRGIRYYTGATRHKEGPKEYNYVLFDDRDVRMAGPAASKPANKISAETTAAGFKSDLSLSQFVRKMGGIVPTDLHRGELDRLRLRDSGTTDLINQKAQQGNVQQTADIMMQAANDAGYRDPKTGQPFENPGDFIYAVERDVLGDKIRVRTGDEDFSAAEAEYYADQEARARAEEARDNFLESGRGAELFDKVRDGKASNAEFDELTKLASEAGISKSEIEDTLAGARAEIEELEDVRGEGPPTQTPARAEQLGFVQEGLTQQTVPPKSTSQRDALIQSEQQRQAELNPERTAALARLDEIRRRGMTVDDYARQPDLMGNVPSEDEIRLLKELESAPAESSEESGQLNFGPGTMRAGEPLPEVKERKFGTRFTEDERIADEIRSEIGTAKYYEPIPNKITAAQAAKLVDERGIGESIRIIRDEKNDLPAHIRSTMGQIVIQRLNQTYKNLKQAGSDKADVVLEQAVDLAEWAMDYGTRLGQGVQSFAMWARLTPEGILLTYKRAVNKARQRQQKLFGEDIAEIIRTINREGLTEAEREEALRKLFKTNKTARKVKSEIDKLLEAAKTGMLTDTLFYEIVGDKLGLPNYSRETAERITDLAHQIEEAPEGLPRNKLVLELQKFIAEQKGFDVVDLPLGIFYGNILSGYNTHAVNFADTGLNVLSEINGLVLNDPRAAARIYAGMLRGFAEGRFDAMLELSRGRMVTDGKWLEVPRLMEIAKFGKPGGVPIKTATKTGRALKKVAESKIAIPLNAYKYVTRAMAASDAVMFRAAKEARATLLAYRTAKAEGLEGAKLEQRVRVILALDREGSFVAQARREGFTGNEAEFRAKELREMAREHDLSADAAEFAGEATYNHVPHGTLGLIAERVGKLSEDVKPLKLFVPFTRIVANVTNRGLNYTPYGYKRAFAGWGFGANAEPLTAEGRRLMLTRATMGTAGMILLAAMQEAGLIAIHGNGPTDREKRRQMQNAGWRPYSLQIGNVYISYVYSPVGLGLSIIGNMKDADRYHELQQKDAATRGAYAVARLGSTIFSQSFLSGLSRLFSALSDRPEVSVTAVKQTLGGTVSAFGVPNIARDLHRLFDNTAYQSNTLTEDLIRNTPFAALALKPQLNAFGEPVKLQRQRFFDIQTSDPAWRFVIQKGLRVPVPGRTTEIEKGKRITPEQYYKLLKTTGPEVRQWILDNQTFLEPMTETEAQDELSEAATAIRKRALDEMRGKMVKPMKPPAPPKPEAPERP